MAKQLRARLIPAQQPGSTITDDTRAFLDLPEGYRLYRRQDLGIQQTLPPPFESIPVLPKTAAYAGEAIAVLVGPEWAVLDQLAPTIVQSTSGSEGVATVWTDQRSRDARGGELPEDEPREHDNEPEPAPAPQIAEGTYHTALQLHLADAPLWAEAHREDSIFVVAAPKQWPSIVRAAVAEATGQPRRAVRVSSHAPSGVRDAALWQAAIVAAVAAVLAQREDASVTVAYRADQRYLTGGRSPGVVSWASRLDGEGLVIENTVHATVDCGAYPTLVEETRRRLYATTTGLYRLGNLEYGAKMTRSPAVPSAAFEGVGSAQLSFAREVHFNRLAELAEEDPILWRQRHLRSDWPVIQELLENLGEEADFHRRYAANELVRKRRLQLPRNTAALKGIGCALGEQISGVTGEKEIGSLAVRLDQGGTAELYCSIPTPSPRLTLAWRQIVAHELELDIAAVHLRQDYETEQQDSGPRLFSRGSSVVPRTIQSVCQAIQKQRFREPLPIQIRRSIRTSRAARTPADALRSAGAAAVEATLLPSSMEIEVRSVTLAVYAGRILDRGMAEAELRRGIYQALGWSLHEAVEDPAGLVPATGAFTYPAAFRGRLPRIRIVFGTPVRHDGPTGVAELPFLTVPAALTSALSQASGLYLDRLPTRPATLLRMLQED